MGLQVTIDGHSEAIVRSQLAQGKAGSAEELIERALESYSRQVPRRFSLGSSGKTTAQAIADILDLRQTVSLGGLTLKELTHAGHKY